MKLFYILLSLNLLFGSVYTFGQKVNNNRVILSGTLKGIYDQLRTDCDTLTVEIFENHLTNSQKTYGPAKRYIAKITEGTFGTASLNNAKFKFEIDDLHGPAYFTMRLSMGLDDLGHTDPALLDNFLVEPGDSIFMDLGLVNAVFGSTAFSKKVFVKRLDIDKASFSGKGAAKYDFLFKTKGPDVSNWTVLERKYLKDSIRKAWFNPLIKLSLLQQYKEKISPIAYQVIKADLEFNHLNTASPNDRKELSDSSLFLSYQYTLFVIDSLKKIKISDIEAYNVLKKYPADLRDKLIAYFILEKYSWLSPADASAITDDAVMTVRYAPYLEFLRNMKMQLQPGSKAYNFSLTDDKGKKRSLSEFNGKTILLDFWYTGCPPCAGFYQQTLSVAEEELRNDSTIVFITVAIDQDIKGWINSIKRGEYTSFNAPNVVNLYTNGAGKDHPVIKYYNVLGYPRPLIIDKSGNIFRSSDVRLPAEELITLLRTASK